MKSYLNLFKKKWIFFSVLSPIFLFSQIGINTTNVNANTLLHISERNEANEILNKGILIPRLTEQQRNVINVSKNSNGDFDVSINDNNNGLMIFNTTENCFNHWHSIDQEWKSLCGNFGRALFTFDCSKVVVEGNYIVNKEVNGSQFITINDVNVTKPGSYMIIAKSVPSNGYSFIGEGTFTSTGLQTIRLYAQGIPNSSKTDTFNIDSSGDDNQENCTVDIDVQPNTATYNINCSSAIINGTYSKGTTLTSENTIKISVNVGNTGYYNIYTEETNGISFNASGIFTTTGIQNLTLKGNGVPIVNVDFPITIKTNTVSGNNICDINVPIILPHMTYAVIGHSSYSWDSSHSRGKAINSINFSPTGTFKIASLTKAWETSDITIANSNLAMNPKPDVILFFGYGTANLNDNLALSLSNYVNNGGVLIYGSKDNRYEDVNMLLEFIYGSEYNNVSEKQIENSDNASPYNSKDDNIYPISTIPNDPIINGPFGNASGKYWGEDNSSSGSIIVKKLPPNSIQIATAYNQFSKFTVNPEYSTVWYNTTKKIVYFGDSVGSNQNNNSLTDYPSDFSATYIPLVKRYGQYPNQNTQAQFVYNSILELNALAWALKIAATEGINQH